MSATIGYAALQRGAPLQRFDFERREPDANDVAIDILFCGICHSDIHQVNNDWGFSQYPMVPGHEIIGRVTAVGSDVTRFAVGDLVGVGCMVDSCRHCPNCDNHEEQYCLAGNTQTYNTKDLHSGGVTYGGYSKKIVVTQDFVLRINKSMDPAAAAPLLCAGITTYTPLKRAQVGKGSKIGIVGLGGLGHMAVKLAHAMGAYVTVFTTSPNKVDAAKQLGASDVVLSTDEQAMHALANQYDFILDTVSAKHDMNRYLNLLKVGGQFTQVGLPPEPMELPLLPMIFKRLSVSGSLIGGIKDTQEMLDFCAEHHITADIELIRMDEINTAFKRLEQGDVKYRFVIDMSTLT
ncbi:NAD(P)-dependent alcohol dehydrogenase [Legionella bononiensis]|uniref:NAD(P)-dependent alcohol dehydrogenase n=1 Tax=Legionella bononiensis TaxID=2793102 RepID=A0ABS1W793_9GAMM|nr:NAD(P)-dependent alcohol dehydrogenase [Legionella bononiensis]MBL7481325.1 NAD(P)-dependent alcohol dehydrogenase [Legionella bononiensis]MBL7525229.1 NAD(P)-dependent alcohol dehydrogenase [Legionella bononiensis]MBL7561413.1 NAD(P)-dependent alcohol dehydrogenase [Legionella bononiensis]